MLGQPRVVVRFWDPDPDPDQKLLVHINCNITTHPIHQYENLYIHIYERGDVEEVTERGGGGGRE